MQLSYSSIDGAPLLSSCRAARSVCHHRDELRDDEELAAAVQSSSFQNSSIFPTFESFDLLAFELVGDHPQPSLEQYPRPAARL